MMLAIRDCIETLLAVFHNKVVVSATKNISTPIPIPRLTKRVTEQKGKRTGSSS